MAIDPQQEADFEKALAFTLEWEGGYTNDPDDPGGPTNLGIIQTEYDVWRDQHGNARQSVKFISHAEAREIYLEKYWLATHCGLLPWPASAALFDTAVNSGNAECVKLLQRALGLNDDGVCGPQTQAAMAKVTDGPHVQKLIVLQRDALDRAIAAHRPASQKFLAGWLNRCQALAELP